MRIKKISNTKSLQTLPFASFSLAGEEGFEPPLTVLETAALPLYYAPRSSTENDYLIEPGENASAFCEKCNNLSF